VSNPPKHDHAAGAPTLVDCDAIAGELRRQIAYVRVRMEAHREIMRAAGLTSCGGPPRIEGDEQLA
jgi:hypothetical protein